MLYVTAPYMYDLIMVILVEFSIRIPEYLEQYVLGFEMIPEMESYLRNDMLFQSQLGFYRAGLVNVVRPRTQACISLSNTSPDVMFWLIQAE